MLRPHDYRDSKVSRVLSHEFWVVRLYRTFSIYIVTEATRYAGCCAQMMWFEVVQAHRTCSNLLEPHHYKDSKVCRVLSHEFGVVRLYRTFSIYIGTGETRYAGCLCTSSGWFKHIESRRTFSNHIITEIKVCRVLSHEFGVVRLYRTFSIYIVAGETRFAGCLCTCSGRFKHIEPRRTFQNHIITEIAKCVEFCHMSSGCFDHTEPSLSTSVQGKQGMKGAYALVRGGSSTSNLVEPSRTTSLQR